MAMKISRKLIETDSGELFVVSGNPDVGYDLAAVELRPDVGYDLAAVELRPAGHFQRSWQAVKAARELAGEVGS